VLWLGTLPGLNHRERPAFAYTLTTNWKATKKERIGVLFPHQKNWKSSAQSAISRHNLHRGQSLEFLIRP
jgi:hypothetical protein